MKEAMWGVGVLALCLFGLVLVNLFGDITVTNQQDYIAMKNTVEASMHDAIDLLGYRYGFCLCTNQKKSADGRWNFTSSSQYTIHDLKDDSCQYLSSKGTCEVLKGETKINTDIFKESLIRRLGEVLKDTKNYQVIVQEVIEYPPKVSVMIKSGNTFNIFNSDDDDFEIVNKIDAILEEKEN